MWNNIVDKIKYNDCVIDCYINNFNEAILIEINSGCSWSISGSSLFHWEEIINMKKKSSQIIKIIFYEKIKF